jgi:hypothetical protein
VGCKLHLHVVVGVLHLHRKDILRRRHNLEEMLQMFNNLPKLVSPRSLIDGAMVVLHKTRRHKL